MLKRASLTMIGAVAASLLFAGLTFAQTVDTTPPTTPTNVKAQLSKYVQVNVTWTASKDNVKVVGYNVYRNGVFVGQSSVTSFTDGVSPGATYSYTVTAYDAAGNVSYLSAPSPPLSVLVDTTPPSAPVWSTITPSTSSIVLSWSQSTDNVGIAGYSITRNGNPIPAITALLTGTTYTDKELEPGSGFNYVVTAHDLAGNVANSNVMVVKTGNDLTPPAAPTGLQAWGQSSREIDLSWNPSTDNARVVGYYVYRDGTQIGKATSTKYADTSVQSGSTHLYAVAAYDATGNVSAKSFTVSASAPSPSAVLPTIPGSFTATVISSSEIDLSWLPSESPSGIVNYRLMRNSAMIATIASSAASYADKRLASNTFYLYDLRAYDATGNGSPPAYSSATTPPTSQTSPAPQGPVNSTSPTAAAAITLTLTEGMQNGQVKDLQTLLIGQDDLGSQYATGYFGSLTKAAVEKFQCAEHIVCSGTSETTGYGLVGPKTRVVLNSVSGSGSTSSSTSVSVPPTTPSTAASSAESGPSVQELETELQALEAQLNALKSSAP